MTVSEGYIQLKGNYQDIIARMGSEERVKRLLNMFAEDCTVRDLKAALEKQDYDTAFLMAHTLKGVVMNLGLTDMFDSVIELTDLLRNDKANREIPTLADKIYRSYERLLEIVSLID